MCTGLRRQKPNFVNPKIFIILQYKKDNMKEIIKDTVIAVMYLFGASMLGAALVIGIYTMCGY